MKDDFGIGIVGSTALITIDTAIGLLELQTTKEECVEALTKWRKEVEDAYSTGRKRT